MARVSIFLIVVALIVGTVGCGGESYALAIISGVGGNVTAPGEGMFSYVQGTVINLVATPDEGYGFVDWTGNVSTIANISAATTSITVNGNYFVMANFELVANVPPIINSLQANTTEFVQFSSLNVTCDASDPNNDELSCEWTSVGGYFNGTGPEVTWTALWFGPCNITVVVKDGHGGSAISSLNIDVVPWFLPLANLELQQVISASIEYVLDNYVWPETSDDLVGTGYINGTLKAVYIFDTDYGWVLSAYSTISGWPVIIMFAGGVAGRNGAHGRWVLTPP